MTGHRTCWTLGSSSLAVSLWSGLQGSPSFMSRPLLQEPQLANRGVKADTVPQKGSLPVPDTQRLEEDRQQQRAQGEGLVLCL